MDGEQVRAWEARCIEEQPPSCVAACPLHLDVRTMMEKVAAGDFAAAFAVYARHVPFPAILGHICDHPCETACRRSEAGGALAIGLVEKAIVEEAHATLRRSARRNRKPKTVAVVGAGLAGLTAAHDLVTKGHAVTVFEADAHPLERLRHDFADRLPEAALEGDLAMLRGLGVEIRVRARVDAGDGPFGLATLARDHDAVLVAPGRGPTPGFAPTLPLRADGRIDADRDWCTTAHPKIFAACVRPGDLDAPDGAFSVYSPIGSMHDGRRAAGSIDRFLQGASLTASRTDDGSGASCLFVNVATHEAVAPIAPADPTRGYDRAEAIAEAARCFPCRCRECVKACEYLAHYGSYPKRYVREIWNNDGIIMGNRKANRMIDGCTLCGLCETLCPNDLAMGEVCLDARRSMVARGKMPPSHHDFALREMAFYRSGETTIARHQPGHDTSATLFFPGCQLAASEPDHVARIYDHLAARLSGGVGLLLDCCGAPAHWSGREALQREVAAGLDAEWRRLGQPTVITACSSCLKMFREFHPDWTVESLWTRLAKIGLPEVERANLPTTLAIHDPCTARHDGETQAAVRAIAAELGVDLRELGGAELTTCCGYGGLVTYADPVVADRIVDRRIAEDAADYLAYCAMCRDGFARRGKRTAHLLDLVFADGPSPDPTGRPDPGISQRHDARIRLRNRLMRDLWGEDMTDTAPRVDLLVPEDVRLDMERKLLLIEDAVRVVAEAEASGRKLEDPATGHLVAAHRKGEVTCWVAYEPRGAGFVLHRAWSHRMSVEAKP